MVDTGSKNYLTIALEEVASGKVKLPLPIADAAAAHPLIRPYGARLLLGVSGGIAAYKALELTRLAMKAGHSVRVVQTEASTRFVGTASFAGITGAPVLRHRVGARPDAGRVPRRPGARARAALAPRAGRAGRRLPDRAGVRATRSPSWPHGHADNLLTAAALACRRPLIVAPAMNEAMYEHPATQENLARCASAA